MKSEVEKIDFIRKEFSNRVIIMDEIHTMRDTAISLKDEKLMLDFIGENQKNINGITVGKLVCTIN